jgi:prepilin-type N-terminal cleavage/methylation domain-containing protein
MRRGFTLLELIIVIVIIGILATLGIQQYGRMVERSRGAEARQILGQIRSTAAAFFTEHRGLGNFDNAAAGIGAGDEQVPSACRTTHYFLYNVDNAAAANFTASASRCTAGGKTPDSPTAGLNLTLETNFTQGTDTWGGSGGY